MTEACSEPLPRRVRRVGAQAAVELLDPDEHVAHVGDGVDAEVGPGAVRRPALRLDLEADEALVRERQAHLGGLRDDGCVGAVALGDPRGADAGDLLVGDRRDDHVPAQPRPGGLGAREHDRGQAGLHVVRAAPVQPPVLDGRLERPLHAGHADRVHVRVEEERLAAAGAARDADRVEPARRELLDLDLEAGVLQPPRDEAGDFIRRPRPRPCRG